MKTSFLLIFVAFTRLAEAQSPCANMQLYDQVIVKNDQPIFAKLKRFDKNLVPDSTLRNMKTEITRLSSKAFFSSLNIKSVRVYDSALEMSNELIVTRDLELVFFYYAVLFETKSTNGTPFVFRLDVMPNGKLVNENQIAFVKKGKLNILSCEKIMKLVLADTTQPVKAVEFMMLAYDPLEQIINWTVVSIPEPKTKIQYFKEFDALTGKLLKRYEAKREVIPITEELQAIETKN